MLPRRLKEMQRSLEVQILNRGDAAERANGILAELQAVSKALDQASTAINLDHLFPIEDMVRMTEMAPTPDKCPTCGKKW